MISGAMLLLGVRLDLVPDKTRTHFKHQAGSRAEHVLLTATASWDPQVAASKLECYVVDLLLNEVRRTRGFSIDDEQVLEEWLYHYPLGRKRRVFERDSDDFGRGDESGRSKLATRTCHLARPGCPR